MLFQKLEYLRRKPKKRKRRSSMKVKGRDEYGDLVVVDNDGKETSVCLGCLRHHYGLYEFYPDDDERDDYGERDDYADDHALFKRLVASGIIDEEGDLIGKEGSSKEFCG